MKKNSTIRTFNGVKFELISVLNVDKAELLQRIKNLKKSGAITKARIITIPITEAEYPKLHKWGHKFNYLLYAVCVPQIFVNRIPAQTTEAFSPNDISLGFLNEHEFYDLCIQIKEARAEGYYAMFEGEKLIIPSDGRVMTNMPGFFDNTHKLLKKLLFG